MSGLMIQTSNLHDLVGAATELTRRGLRIAGNADIPLPEILRRDESSIVPEKPTSEPDMGAAPNDLPELNDALHAKMSRLLDRSLEQNTCDTRLELYERIVDQLVADEARILRALSDGATSPLVNVYSQPRWWSVPRAVVTNVSLIGRTAGVTLPAMTPTYVANLLQLGLVEIGPEARDSTAGYEVLLAEPRVMRAAENGRYSARVERLSLRLSELGNQLWMATMGSSRE